MCRTSAALLTHEGEKGFTPNENQKFLLSLPWHRPYPHGCTDVSVDFFSQCSVSRESRTNKIAFNKKTT